METVLLILKIALIVYIIIDISVMFFGIIPFAISRHLFKTLIIFIMGKYSCKLNIHKWKYTTKNVDTEGNANQMTLFQRECTGLCKKKQYSFYPQHSTLFDYWRDTEPK